MHDSTSPDERPRRLVLMRHARAEQAGTTDFDRLLAPVGEADAMETGRWLADAGVVAQGALVSAAARAQATWAAVTTGAGWRVEPAFDRGLYTADPDTALDLIRLTSDEVATLVVVGHNPTIASLVQLLDDGEGDPMVGIEIVAGFPPGSAAVLEHAGGWAELGWAAARVTAYHPGHR